MEEEGHDDARQDDAALDEQRPVRDRVHPFQLWDVDDQFTNHLHTRRDKDANTAAEGPPVSGGSHESAAQAQARTHATTARLTKHARRHGNSQDTKTLGRPSPMDRAWRSGQAGRVAVPALASAARPSRLLSRIECRSPASDTSSKDTTTRARRAPLSVFVSQQTKAAPRPLSGRGRSRVYKTARCPGEQRLFNRPSQSARIAGAVLAKASERCAV